MQELQRFDTMSYLTQPPIPFAVLHADRFFGNRRYLTPASLFATRGCNRRCSFCVSSRYMGPYRTKPLEVLEQEIDQPAKLHPRAFLQFTHAAPTGGTAYGQLRDGGLFTRLHCLKQSSLSLHPTSPHAAACRTQPT